MGAITGFKPIDLSRRKTRHVWNSPLTRPASTAYAFSDGSLIVVFPNKAVVRLDACSNFEWRKRWKGHHSIERTAGGNFWRPVTDARTPMFREDELLTFSPADEVLTRISLMRAPVRNGYRYLVYRKEFYADDPLHINDVQPVLRDGPFWQRGDLFISVRTKSVLLLYWQATDEGVWLQAGS